MPEFKGFRFDRDLFFEQFRAQFGPIPVHKPYVVDGLNRLLTGFETYYGWWDDLRQIANALAQVGWETAFSYTPVVEAYYLGDPNKPGYFQGNTERVRSVQRTFWYYPHIGRGDIQCTHAENYRRADAYIRKYFPERVTDFEQRTRTTFNLVRHPEQMFDGWISFCTFTVGMHLGTFRKGHNLDRYINPIECDHYAAREIVNGDKSKIKPGQHLSIGRQIEQIAKKFERILNAARIESHLTEITDEEIDLFGDGIGSTAAGPAGSSGEPSVSYQNEDLTSPVESPNAEAGASPEGAPPPLPADESIGDPPDADPSFFLNIEDWKPWAIRWASRIWKGVTSISLPVGGGTAWAAVQAGPNWYIWAIAGAVFLFLTISLGILATLVIAGIWLWQNRGIPDLKLEQFRSFADPLKKNIGLKFEKK